MPLVMRGAVRKWPAYEKWYVTLAALVYPDVRSHVRSYLLALRSDGYLRDVLTDVEVKVMLIDDTGL